MAKYCRQQLDTCGHCGTQGHKRDTCTSDVSCFHCKRAHRSSDKSCQKYIIECDVLKTQNKEKTSRVIALDLVLARYPQHSHLYDQSEAAPSVSAHMRPSSSPVETSRNLSPTMADSSSISPRRSFSGSSPVTVASTVVVPSGMAVPLSSASGYKRTGSASPRPRRERSPPGGLRTVVASVSVHRERSRPEGTSHSRDSRPRAESASSFTKDTSAPKPKKYTFTRVTTATPPSKTKTSDSSHPKRKISPTKDSGQKQNPSRTDHTPAKKRHTSPSCNSRSNNKIPVLGS